MREGGAVMSVVPEDIIGNIASGNINFESLTGWTDSIYEMVSSNSIVLSAWNNFVASNQFIRANLSIIFLVISLLVAFYGQKLTNVIKFVTVFTVSFCLAACYISRPLEILADLPEWVAPLIVAILVTAFGDWLFNLLAGAAAALPAYVLIMNPFYPIPFIGGNQVVAALAAIVSLIVCFVYRKYLGRAGYALLGGFLTAQAIRNFYDYTTFLPTLGKWLPYVVAIAIAIVGYIHQHKTRRRFY